MLRTTMGAFACSRSTHEAQPPQRLASTWTLLGEIRVQPAFRISMLEVGRACSLAITCWSFPPQSELGDAADRSLRFT